MKVLGIESSCDETSVGVYDSKTGCVTHQSTISQALEHAKYGGIHVGIASRRHIENILPVMQHANICMDEIHLIAYTSNPGMQNSLIVGASFAKALAFSRGIKSIAVNHIHGHIMSSWFAYKRRDIPLRYISLVITGGHTEIYLVNNGDFTMLGHTLDDAIGEFLDKSARMMNMNYPGGPEIEQCAVYGKNVVEMPSPKTVNDLDFSFSGLKSHVSRVVRQNFKEEDVCCSIQHRIAHILQKSIDSACKNYQCDICTVVGGVISNKFLRESLKRFGEKKSINLVFPKPEYCTDNGAMIALQGYHLYQTDHSSVDGSNFIKVSSTH